MAKDQKELFIIVEDMADHLPIEDPNKGEVQNMLHYTMIISHCKIPFTIVALTAVTGLTCNDQDGRKWTVKRQRRKCFIDCAGCFCKT